MSHAVVRSRHRQHLLLPLPLLPLPLLPLPLPQLQLLAHSLSAYLDKHHNRLWV